MGSKVINEMTTSSASGPYSNTPLLPGVRLFNKQQTQPFYINIIIRSFLYLVQNTVMNTFG